MTKSANPLADDLDHVLRHTEGLWNELRGQRVFITGGTGFFGCWLLESFLWANDRLDLGAHAVVLTRNPSAFHRKAPRLAAHAAVKLHTGDVRSFDFPRESFSHVIHAATEASAQLNENQPQLMFDTIVRGTQRVLDFSRQAGVQQFLLTSSGAVYGRQPPDLTHLSEEFPGVPDPLQPDSAYGEGKRAAETLCARATRQHGVQTKIARCFAFVGPHLPLDAHFAIGNFIRDALKGGPIEVNGDGTPRRSYLYAADLMVWLWTILFRAPALRPYNVGSPNDLSIGEVATAVNTALGGPCAVQIHGSPTPGRLPSRYVPSVKRAEDELGLRERVDLPTAIVKTASWWRKVGSPDSRPTAV